MKRLTTLLLLAVALVTPVFSQSPTDALFPTTPTSYTTDKAALLTSGQSSQINSLAQRLKETTKVELAVVTLPTLNDRAPVDVATAIGRKWGVGSVGAVGSEQRNAGLVLLIVPRQGEVRGKCFIAVGNGMEGRITDLIASRICTETIAPTIRASGMNDGAGIIAGVERIQHLASITALKTTDSTTAVGADAISTDHSGWWLLGGILGLILIAWGAWKILSSKEPEYAYTSPTPEPDSGMGLATAAIIASSVGATPKYHTSKPKESDEDSNSSSGSSSYSSDWGGSSSSGGGSDFGGFGGGGGFSG